jgi:hypothetical protein
MKASILHDGHGHIVSVAKIGDLKAAGSKFTSAGLIPGAGQHLTEVELSAEDEKLPLHELHARYRVEAKTAKLVKKHS